MSANSPTSKQTPEPMTREAAIALLRAGAPGVKTWNKYRDAGGAVPMLWGIEYDNVNLSGVNLAGANLTGAVLNDVNLSRANLAGASLSGAQLTNVVLTRANLSGANLEETALNGVFLDGANLNRASLHKATAERTEFSEVELTSRRWLSGRRWWRTWASIRLAVNWRMVRAAGNLQILTRASYLMLVLVPALAAVWPDVRLWFEMRYQHADARADELERQADVEAIRAVALESLEENVKALEVEQSRSARQERMRELTKQMRHGYEGQPELISKVNDLEKKLADPAGVNDWRAALFALRDALHPPDTPARLKERADEHRTKAAEDRRRAAMLRQRAETLWLPWAWALAFAASVFVVLGQLVYQLFAPPLIRETTAEGLAESLWNGAIQEDHVQPDAVIRAQHGLRELAAVLPDTRHPQLVMRHGRVVFFPDSAEAFGTKDAGDGLRALIEEGAKAEYLLQGYRKYSWVWLSLLAYAAGGLLILVNVGLQTLAVAHARGL